MHVINNDSAILQRRRSKTGVNTTHSAPATKNCTAFF